MIEFEKWHGNGNDFVIVNSIEQELKIKKSFIKKISDRNKGIGFDQLIHIGLPTKDQYSFFVRFYNFMIIEYRVFFWKLMIKAKAGQAKLVVTK